VRDRQTNKQNKKDSKEGIKKENNNKYIFFVIIISFFLKNSVFWDTTSCSPLKVNRRIVSPPSSVLKSEPRKEAASSKQLGML
jgi:hypothetical protein